MNRQTFTVAEELDEQKSKINRERQLKLTKDRRHHNGKLAQTDGLKTIHKSVREPLYVDEDDRPIDLTRVRSYKDVVKD